MVDAVTAETPEGLGPRLLWKDAFFGVSATSMAVWRRAWLRVVRGLLQMSVGIVYSGELGWCSHGGFLAA